MLDLILVNPFCMNRMGIFTIAAYVRQKGFSVQIIDGEPDEVKDKLLFTKAKVIGISATTDIISYVFDLCNFIKEKCSDSYCILGGFHATALPEETLKESKFDAIIVGEGELTMVDFLQKIKEGTFPTKTVGTMEKYNGKIIDNGYRSLIKDLDILPFPAFDLVDMNKYIGSIRNNQGNLKKVIYLLVSRGCPFNCVFCASAIMWKRKLRFYSNEYILHLIRHLIKEYDIDGIAFLDDELIVNQEKILDLCMRFTGDDLAKWIKWECQARASSVTEDILRNIKQAGCIQIRFGLESGNEQALGFLKRNTITVDQNYHAVALCNKLGMICHGSFIIGYPEETIFSIVDTIKFIETSGLDYAEVYMMIPYPGTFMFDYSKKNNLLEPSIDWNDFLIEEYGLKKKKPILRCKNFTAEQLENIRQYIEVNIIYRLNSGKEFKKLDHYVEIQAILGGNLSKTKYGCYFYMEKGIHKVKTAIRHPTLLIKKPFAYIFKFFASPLY